MKLFPENITNAVALPICATAYSWADSHSKMATLQLCHNISGAHAHSDAGQDKGVMI